MFEFILMSADTAVERFVFGTWSAIIEASAPLVTALLVVLVALVGIGLWQGRIELGRRELAVRVLQVAVVYTLVTNVDALDRLLYRVTTDVPGAVATAMLSSTAEARGETPADINRSLDLVFVQGIETGGRILDQASLTDFGTVLLGFVMIGVVLVALIPVAFVLLLAKLAVGVLLGLAPLALLLYLFDTTRSLVLGYLRQLLGFALIPTMVYALLGLVLGMVAQVSTAVAIDAGGTGGATSAATGSGATAGGLPGLDTVAPYILVMIVVGLLASQVVAWSSGIANALALSATSGFAALGAAPGAAVTVGRRALRGAGGSGGAQTREPARAPAFAERSRAEGASS